MTRNHSIDTLRSLAIFFVVFLHVSAEYVYFGQHQKIFNHVFWIGNIIDSFCRICVPLFVLISGSFLLGRSDSVIEMYIKRAKRILLPLCFWVILYSIYKYLISYYSGNPISINSLILPALLGKPFYHLWYLYMIIGLYLFTPFLNLMIPKIPVRATWSMAFVFLGIGMVNSFFDSYFNNKVFFLLWFINYLGYYMLGYLISKSKISYPTSSLLIIYFLSSSLIAVLTYFTIKNFDSLYFYGYLSPLVIIASLSFYKIFQQANFKENILSKMAPLTLGIYLIHSGLLDFLNYQIKIKNISFVQNPLWAIPLKSLIIFSISFVFAFLLYKIKFLRRLI